MTPADFFAPLDDANTPYRELCEKLRTMNEEDLEKVSTFIGWIEKKGKRSIITHQGQKKKHLGQEVQKIR